jgi:hypothetical protein
MSYLSLIPRLERKMVEQTNWNVRKRKLLTCLVSVTAAMYVLSCPDLCSPARAELGNKQSPWERAQ